MSNKKISKAFSTSMSKFFITSISTIIGLYFIFTLFLLILFELKGWSLESLLITSLVVLIINFLIAPNLMDWTLNLFYKISWRNSNDLPEYLKAFLTTICEEKNIKFPKIGIINDGSPNSTYAWNHKLTVRKRIESCRSTWNGTCYTLGYVSYDGCSICSCRYILYI